MTNFNRFCIRYGETAIFLLNVMYVIGKNKALKVFNTLRALFLIPVMYVTNVSVDFD